MAALNKSQKALLRELEDTRAVHATKEISDDEIKTLRQRKDEVEQEFEDLISDMEKRDFYPKLGLPLVMCILICQFIAVTYTRRLNASIQSTSPADAEESPTHHSTEE